MRRSVPALVLLLASATAAQLADLQPGRNFPTASSAFGAGRTFELDVADVDNDGDLDVGAANGGDGTAQANGLFVNQGGFQAGVEGSFVDDSALRFAGIPNDRSRDIEFADFDDDGDLDVFIVNSGINSNPLLGISRAHLNLGGKQGGTIGFFTEDTENFWGQLVSVPLADESGVQDGMGPFAGYSCDCEFADMDSDGDLDLFHAAYGPNLNGAHPSRVFLNDGAGRFDELWPWADPAADVNLHTVDVKLADFDDDLDLDVFASSRDSQARAYRNNLAEDGWASTPFTDVTLPALVHNGATLQGSSNYATEFGDLDGDGDFDIWAAEYNAFSDRLLLNDGDMTFTMDPDWIVGELTVGSGSDNENVVFVDYDADGDLDAFQASFAGTNHLYQNGAAQGYLPAQGLFHRTGSPGAPAPEMPVSGNAGTSMDGEIGDLDGDGDHDLLIANDSNFQNKMLLNVLGVPDTHAPSVHALTVQGDKTDGSDTPIVAQVRDNAPFFLVSTYATDLWVAVDGGLPSCQRMARQAGQQFRGLIPGGLTGSISYWVTVTDDAGNVGVSARQSYSQAGALAPPLWQALGCGTPGIYGTPELRLSGSQVAGTAVTFDLRRAKPDALFLLWIATGPTPISAVGGTVFALPATSQLTSSTDSGGQRYVSTTWPAGLPPGTELWWQVVVADSSSLHGLNLSNGVKSVSP